MSADGNDLLEAFKAAALSVTKLYKTSAQAQAKSRADGYQDCLEDLLAFLDRENVGFHNGEGQKVRKWVTDRVEGRDGTSPPLESDDEADRSDAPVLSSPQMQRAIPATTTTTQRQRDKDEAQPRDASAPPMLMTVPAPPQPAVDDIDIVVPSQDTFNFQTSHPYPHDEALRLASLNLSDSQTMSSSNNRTTPRNARNRNGRTGARTALGRGAGLKRKVNLAEIFDLGSLEHGNGRDMFGGGGKRSRFA